MDAAKWDVAAWFSAAEWSAVWTGATFFVALIAAVIALAQFGYHLRTSREQSRPFVIVDFQFRTGIVLIDVRNTGATAASDVRFTWDPVPHADDDRSERALQKALVADGIPFLAPGREIRFLLGDFSETLAPRRFRVTADYLSPYGKRRWRSESVLDLDQWAHAVADNDPNAKIARHADKTARATEQAAKALGRIVDLLRPASDLVRDSAAHRNLEEREEAEREDLIERLKARSMIRVEGESPQSSAAESPATLPPPSRRTPGHWRRVRLRPGRLGRG